MSSDSSPQRAAEAQSRLASALTNEIGKVLVGQETMVNRLLIGLLVRGHVLLEGMPGLAKTLTVKSLAAAIETDFSRIQFTPDMLPADVIGTEVFNPKEGTYSVKQGPIFSHLVLADEINRAPAKVQSAMLEVMQERQVTIGGKTFMIDEPFMVLATQNPVEQEGTYPLPEAQIDRFTLKVNIDYPTVDEERKVLDRMGSGKAIPEISPVASVADVMEARRAVDEIFVDEKIRDYIVSLVRATRDPAAAGVKELEGLIEHGASPRASIRLMQTAKASAFLAGRSYVTPHDVKTLAPDVLRHRVSPSYEAEAEGHSSDDLIAKILDNVLVP
jgi:MoxR-like ATPase